MVDNVEFPLVISYNSVGGPGFATQVVTPRSGAEGRNPTMSQPRRKWTADLAGITRVQMASIIPFWLARQGKNRGFRFQDPFDYWAISQPLAPITGSTLIQLTMTYADTANPTVRNITRPVQADTTEKAYTGIELFKTHTGVTTQLVEGSDYTVDYTAGTGLVTLTAAAIAGDTYAWTGQFDCAARFDIDEPKWQEEDFDSISWKGFAMIEILEPES